MTLKNSTDHRDLYQLLATWEVHHFKTQLSLMLLLLTCVILKSIYAKLKLVPSFFPESLILICIGAGIGSLLSHVLPKGIDQDVWHLTPHAFFNYLLPCCVLDSAYNLHNRVFGDCIGGVVVYAVLATVLNMVLIGLSLVFFEYYGILSSFKIKFGVQILMLFSSLIVAVDPVAVLAIFQEIGVELSLYYLVLGESLLNDAVTLVLYKIVNQFLEHVTLSSRDIGFGLAAFFTINFGAILIGITFGILTCFITKIHTHFEIVFVFLLAYLSYVLGDIVGWSGIVAMITCGMIQTAYAFHNLDDKALTAVRQISKQLAEVNEAIIFLLIGVQIVRGKLQWDSYFSLLTLAMCLAVRTIVVMVLTIGLNTFNVNMSKINLTQQFILAYGGLRGAVCLSLAIMIDRDKLDGQDERIYDTILTTTLFIILFTVGVMGPTLKPLVKLFEIKLAEDHTISLVRELNEKMIDQMAAGIESIVGTVGHNSLRNFFVRLDEKYIRGCLQNDPQSYNEKIVQVYEEMALVLHYASIDPDKASDIMSALPQTIQDRHTEMMDIQHKLDEEKTRKSARKLKKVESVKVGLPTTKSESVFNFGNKRQEDFTQKYARIMENKKRAVMNRTAGNYDIKIKKAAPKRSETIAKDLE